MKDNILKQKSYKFALDIITIYKYLVETKKEFILSKQLLKSWTSIWANVEESIWWQLEKDFLNKINIAYKEARETKYWINLLFDSWYLELDKFTQISADCEELCKIMWKIISTIKINWRL